MSVVIKDIKEKIAEDSKLSNNLDSESLKITKLQSKWIGMHADYILMLNKANRKLAQIERDKTLYYMGKQPDEVYKEKPLNIKVLKQDLPMFLESDEDYASVKEIVDEITIVCNMIELFLKELSQRSFNIKNAIEYQKFKAGL